MEANGWAVRARGLRKSYGGVPAVSAGSTLVLLAWTGAGLVLCLRTFRWQNRESR